MPSFAPKVDPKNPYDTPHAPTWCPGCGDFAIWISLKKALEQLNKKPHEILIVYGIGCSGNMANNIRTYGWHSLHGRAVPTAVGAKLANRNLTVIVAAGDGDSYGEGLGHFIHAIRGNVNVTYIVHNNSIYGLTTGQASPTSSKGMKAKSTPEGLIVEALNPIALAISAGASFVARGFSGNAAQLQNLMVQAIQHPGFAYLDVFQPCVTFNKLNTYSFYYERVYDLQADKSYTAQDRQAAFVKALESDKLPTGIFYKDSKRKTYEDELSYLQGKPLATYSGKPRSVKKLFSEFK